MTQQYFWIDLNPKIIAVEFVKNIKRIKKRRKKNENKIEKTRKRKKKNSVGIYRYNNNKIYKMNYEQLQNIQKKITDDQCIFN